MFTHKSCYPVAGAGAGALAVGLRGGARPAACHLCGAHRRGAQNPDDHTWNISSMPRQSP